MSSSFLLTLLAASSAQQSRDEAQRAFRASGAISPAQARTLAELSMEANPSIHEFVKSGIVRAVDEEGRMTTSTHATSSRLRYFLDEAAILAEQDAMKAAGSHVWMLVFTIGLLIAIGIATTLLLRGT